jgi:hypothetical protein
MSELFRGELMTMTVPLLRLSVPDRNFIPAESHTNANNTPAIAVFQFQLRMCVWKHESSLSERQHDAKRGHVWQASKFTESEKQ